MRFEIFFHFHRRVTPGEVLKVNRQIHSQSEGSYWALLLSREMESSTYKLRRIYYLITASTRI